MPSLDDLDRRLAAVEARLGITAPGPDQPSNPRPPAAPTGLRETVLRDDRRQLDWDPAGDRKAVEVIDELDPDPATRVKDVVEVGTRSIRSKMAAGARDRRYVLVAVGPTGLRSAPSAPLLVTAARAGTTPPPGPVPPPSSGHQGGLVPTDVLPALKTWTVTTTTGKPGSPTNLYPVGAHASIPGVFYVRPDRGVMFHASVDGVTTPKSKRCRVEGREMADANWTKAAWPSTRRRVLDADMWISTAGLTKRKRVSGLQIHDGGDDVLQVVADAQLGLAVLSDDGDTVTVLDPGYRDEQRFTCRIEPLGDNVRITYNGTKVVEIKASGTGWYWKAGAYLQASMAEHGEPPSAFGQVCVYRLDVK